MKDLPYNTFREYDYRVYRKVEEILEDYQKRAGSPPPLLLINPKDSGKVALPDGIPVQEVRWVLQYRIFCAIRKAKDEN